MARFSSTGSPILLHGPIATALRQPGAPRAAADGSHHNGVLPMRILSCGAQIAALVLAASTALAQTPAQTLTVYTYDSFTAEWGPGPVVEKDRKSTRLNSSHVKISYAVFCLKKKKRSKSQHH